MLPLRSLLDDSHERVHQLYGLTRGIHPVRELHRDGPRDGFRTGTRVGPEDGPVDEANTLTPTILRVGARDVDFRAHLRVGVAAAHRREVHHVGEAAEVDAEARG